MHADSSVLREVTDDAGDLVSVGPVHVWAGGAVQVDVYAGDGLFTQDSGGSSDVEIFRDLY